MGAEGKQAWYDSTSWRLFAAIQTRNRARTLEHVRRAWRHGHESGDSVNASGRVGAPTLQLFRRSENVRKSAALDQARRTAPGARADEAFVVLRGAKPLRCGRAIYFSPRHARTSRGEPVSQTRSRMNGDGAMERLLGASSARDCSCLLGGLLLLFQAYAGVVLMGCVASPAAAVGAQAKAPAPSLERSKRGGCPALRMFLPNSTRSSASPK